ncbi:MAG TPA: type 4a pilus biogenesis protein PilO [Candidatus Hydrogenedentes bacterium]|nr:type 4a pilus biogenesis protein PilO [Candidatus Hydrogenedentota bacterium]HOL75553.1 type 4a pilus biogenesis protein PilO [Candidatus Hydrogenedentota bacterium]HPO87022.1 type 4a pilus biogenesis protein PilO [Candidatus Hydrogenedentota bacterium]
MNTTLFRTTVTPKDWMAFAFLLCLAALLAALFYFVVHHGQKTTLASLEQEDKQVLADLMEAELKRSTIEKLRQEMQKTTQLVSDFDRRLPSTREIATLVTRFEEMANELNLRINVTPLSILRDERKETIPYNIKAYGDFHQITSFINRLERFERYLKISDLKIREEKNGVSEAEFTLSTYRFIEPVPPNLSQTAQAASGAAK